MRKRVHIDVTVLTLAPIARELDSHRQHVDPPAERRGVPNMAAQFLYIFGTLSLLTGGLIAGINTGRATGEQRRLRRDVQTNR